MTVTPTPALTPAAVKADAKNRAVRSYLQGLGVAVLFAALPIAQASLGDIHWSVAWWIALGNAVASPALLAGASYVMRHLSPPPTQ